MYFCFQKYKKKTITVCQCYDTGSHDNKIDKNCYFLPGSVKFCRESPTGSIWGKNLSFE